MSNPQQNEIQNEIEQIKREIDLLRDKLKQTKNRLNLFQNGLKQIEKIQTKKKTEWTKANRKNAESFANQKRQNLLQNRSKGITKMQNIL